MLSGQRYPVVHTAMGSRSDPRKIGPQSNNNTGTSKNTQRLKCIAPEGIVYS